MIAEDTKKKQLIERKASGKPATIILLQHWHNPKPGFRGYTNVHREIAEIIFCPNRIRKNTPAGKDRHWLTSKRKNYRYYFHPERNDDVTTLISSAHNWYTTFAVIYEYSAKLRKWKKNLKNLVKATLLDDGHQKCLDICERSARCSLRSWQKRLNPDSYNVTSDDTRRRTVRPFIV